MIDVTHCSGGYNRRMGVFIEKNSIGRKREIVWQIVNVHSSFSYVDKIKVTSEVEDHIWLAAESVLLTPIR